MDILEIKELQDEYAISMFHQVATDVYQDDVIWAPGSERMFTRRFTEAQTHKRFLMIPVVAFGDGLPLARSVAIFAPGIVDEMGNPQGWIGFFECLREFPSAGRQVLKRCEEILQEEGAKSVLTPKVDNQLVGLLIGGFEHPHVIWTNHNPPYYLELLEKNGYQIKENLFTIYFTRETAEQVQVELPGFTTREFNRKDLEKEIKVFHHLQQTIFGDRPGYMPRSLEEDQELVNSILHFLEDDLVIIAEDVGGKPVGLLICLPDIYQARGGQNIDRVRLMSIGAVPHLAHKGIGALMGAHLMKNLLRRKEYIYAEGSWILGSNVSPLNLAKRFHAKPGREFAILEKRF